MTPQNAKRTDAAAAARDLFADAIPDLDALAADYRVNVNVIDDEIRGLFAEQVRSIAASLTAACAQRDGSAIRERGHTLEGSGGTLGFPEISVAGWALSSAARDLDWDRCAALVERLSRWSRILTASLDEDHGRTHTIS